MDYNNISKGHLKTIGVIVGIILFLLFLFKISSLILYIGIAAVVALIGRPIVSWFKNRLHFNNTASAFATLMLFIGFIVIMMWIFVPIIVEQSKNIADIDLDLIKRDLNELNIQASEYLGLEKINLIEGIKRTDYVRNFNADLIPNFVEIFFDKIGDFLVGLLSVIFISFFLLKDEDLVTHVVTAFAHPRNEQKFISIMGDVKELLSRYFLGLVLQALIITFFYTILLMYLEIPNALAIALICAALNIVPYLGPLLGMAVLVLVTISNNLGADFSSELMPLLIIVAVGVAIAQLFDNLISQPVIFSQSVKSHPLEIFIVIIIGGLLFGVAGMILAVPLYTTIKVILKEFFSEYRFVKRLTRGM